MKHRHFWHNDTIVASKYMLGYIWKDGKGYMFLTIIQSVLNAIFLLLLSVFPGLLINELTGDKNPVRVFVFVAVVTLSPLVRNALFLLIANVLTKKRILLRNVILKRFYCQIVRMDFEHLENPEIQNQKERATDALDAAFNVVDLMAGLLSSVLGLIAVLSLIVMLDYFAILIVVAAVLLNSIILKRMSSKAHLAEIEIENNRRREWGASFMLDNLYFAKEIRIFNLGEMLINRYLSIKKTTSALIYKNQTDRSVASFQQTLIDATKDVVIYAHLVLLVINGLPIGTMSIYLNASQQFSVNLTNVVNAVINISKNSLKIHELKSFMELPLKQYESGSLTPEFNQTSVIEFKNVSFKYPGSERYALKNLNLTIKGNERLCIVGENGAGKSTFIKLLCRLYFPTEGEICLNGININDYDLEKWHRLFTPVFQDFAKYYLSFGENIVLDDSFDKEKLDKTCKECGLFELVEKLPKGYDTAVDKWIDEEGFDPSGGEMQRIAIARASYHGGKVFLLDEPTAALDPSAEYEIYAQFDKMVADNCAILITHRLSAAQIADNIAVFRDGGIVEYGSHHQLLAKNGIYSEMFLKQGEFYREQTEV